MAGGTYTVDSNNNGRVGRTRPRCQKFGPQVVTLPSSLFYAPLVIVLLKNSPKTKNKVFAEEINCCVHFKIALLPHFQLLKF